MYNTELLDDKTTFDNYDPSGLIKNIRDISSHARLAWKSAKKVNLPADYNDVNKIVILGMGGSAISGDLLGTIALLESPVPIIVHRSYELPSYVDSHTLLIASSYSGQTEEVLSAFSQALNNDSNKMVFTGGGKLKAIAEEHGIPLFLMEQITEPEGEYYVAQPRATVVYSLVFLLGVFQKLGFFSAKDKYIKVAINDLDSLIRQWDTDVPLTNNQAKQIASKFAGKCAIVYGAGILSEVAHRWKTQLNENSKSWAFHEVFPELDHNAVVGYEFPQEIVKQLYVVMLKSKFIHPRVLQRYDLTTEICKKNGIKHELVYSSGKSALGDILNMILLGDYVSYYLAMLYKVDPSPVKVINYLKNKLAAM